MHKHTSGTWVCCWQRKAMNPPQSRIRKQGWFRHFSQIKMQTSISTAPQYGHNPPLPFPLGSPASDGMETTPGPYRLNIPPAQWCRFWCFFSLNLHLAIKSLEGIHKNNINKFLSRLSLWGSWVSKHYRTDLQERTKQHKPKEKKTNKQTKTTQKGKSTKTNKPSKQKQTGNGPNED